MYKPTFEYEIGDHGIVTVIVDHFEQVKGSDSWASPDDYYGYTEIEYTVYDSDGNEIELSESEHDAIFYLLMKERDNA